MKRRLFTGVFSAAIALTVFSGATMAAQPAGEPGCFGRDRASYIQDNLANSAEPGNREWGPRASFLATDNVTENRAWRESADLCGSHS